jgi:putative acyl-CoA dehydrogenase
MAIDLLRALRGAGVADALAHELAPLRGAHAALDGAIASVLDSIDGVTDEAQARRLAREAALVLQAAALRRQSPDAVFDAFCTSRLAERSDVFGLLPTGLDLDALVARALPLED